MRHQRLLASLFLGVVTVFALAIGHQDVGYVRDEGIYFEASRRYAAWTQQLARAPADALRPATITKHFGYNFEHPPTMKLAAGLSAQLLAQPPATAETRASGGVLPVLREGTAMRLPAQMLAGLAVGLLFAVGWGLASRLGRSHWAGGLLASGAFIALPRVWFHAGLHAFDVPIAVLVLALVLVYRKALRNWRYALLLGPLWGLSLTIKHNALFVPVLLAVHYAVHLVWLRVRHKVSLRWPQLVPCPFVSLALLGPLTAYALWPWLWHSPIERLGHYIGFHRYHSYYNMELFGQNYNQPPLPMSYPWVMTWATVPTVLLVLALIGLGVALVRDARAPHTATARATFLIPCPPGTPTGGGVLLLLFAAFPLALISHPSVPIFGGTKHWLTAYPFLAIAAVLGFCALCKRAQLPAKLSRLEPLAALLILAPALLATASGHPYNLSQYAPLVGGARGAATIGLNRGFWGYTGLPLAELAAADGARVRLAPHDLHPLCIEQLRREGRWPPSLEVVSPSRAQSGLLFHELHMTSDEVELWNRFGTTAPSANITLHDVPLTSLYELQK